MCPCDGRRSGKAIFGDRVFGDPLKTEGSGTEDPFKTENCEINTDGAQIVLTQIGTETADGDMNFLRVFDNGNSGGTCIVEGNFTQAEHASAVLNPAEIQACRTALHDIAANDGIECKIGSDFE
ncbi:MAG: hypothetical protein LJE91_03020 [Gammaproteobacteria bacterium]|nr:hypothetical protein [Gammaproteobacteria bacterium]